MVRIIIIVSISIVSFLAVFIPGYYFVVPRGPEGVQAENVLNEELSGIEMPEAPGAEPGMEPVPSSPPALDLAPKAK